MIRFKVRGTLLYSKLIHNYFFINRDYKVLTARELLMNGAQCSRSHFPCFNGLFDYTCFLLCNHITMLWCMTFQISETILCLNDYRSFTKILQYFLEIINASDIYSIINLVNN